MDKLRLNCPWDRKQTLDSLKRLTVEETYELNDAIENVSRLSSSDFRSNGLTENLLDLSPNRIFIGFLGD